MKYRQLFFIFIFVLYGGCCDYGTMGGHAAKQDNICSGTMGLLSIWEVQYEGNVGTGRPAPEVAFLLKCTGQSLCPGVTERRGLWGCRLYGRLNARAMSALGRPAPEVAFLLKCTGQSLCPGVTERRGLWGCRLYGRLNARTISALGRPAPEVACLLKCKSQNSIFLL